MVFRQPLIILGEKTMKPDKVNVQSGTGLSTKYIGLLIITLGMIRQFDARIRGLITTMTQNQINELRENQRFKIVQLTRLMAASSTQSFANYDYRAVAHCTELAISDHDISFVDFRTTEGQSVASAGQADNHPADQIIHQEILEGDQKLGEVQMGYNLARIEKQQAAIIAQSDEELRQLDEHTQGDLQRLRIALAAMMVMTVLLTALLVWWLFRRLVLRHLRLAVAQADRIAQGVLDLHDGGTYPHDEMGFLLTSMRDMTHHLHTVVSEVRRAADTIGGVAVAIAQENTDINQRTTEQTATLRETATGIERLTHTVRHSADCARQAEQLAADAWQQAEQGGLVVQQTVTAMDAMNDSSRKIADITGVVNDIAFQTNLLALNAAVEAARAGEHGRGFAVVAGEVRKLAQRSAEAAREIRTLISDSVCKAEEGNRLVSQSGQTLEAIMAAVKKVRDIVVDMATASREQADGIEQVNQAITRLEQAAQHNAALTKEAATASGSLDQETVNLLELMAFFQLTAGDQTRTVT